ncbi:MAG TPA: ribosomal-protein-alanine N-acetyltransferase [Candidatus Bathyarchaeota archaeon]|nr:ribosomal-protein-alanine N-acetyltransferase [Candidatus Bathyarchaeota archaeon]
MIMLKKRGEFKVREFRTTDLERVIWINETCLPENYTPSFYLQHHFEHPKAFLVAEVNGEVVGYVMCRIELGLSNIKFGLTRKGHIISIAVLPEYRRRGIGETLMRKAMEAMREYGATEYYLEVRVSNIPAINLYRKLNYKIVKRIPGYYLDGEDAYVMARPS